MSGYAKDIFISYAHLDNQPLTPGEEGWITRFHATLQALLNMRLGHASRIWRDDKLQGNDVFDEEIMQQFGDTAVLLSILTPRYLNSEWCTREFSEFCAAAEHDGGIVVANKARVFKILKTPVETEETLPSVAKEVLGYEFFAYDNDVPLELDAAYGEEYGQAYKRKVAQLASDLSKLLNQIESAQGEGPQESADEPTTVYLAECSYDQRESREILAGELQQHGYKVLPDRPLPRDETDYIEAVKSMLDRCVFSIHLIGDTYGAVPDGLAQKSVTVLQNDLAVSQCVKSPETFKRIIWLPDGSTSDQPQQQAFIEALHHDAMAQYGADLVSTNLESLKEAIHTALKKTNEPEENIVEVQATLSSENKLVYLICDQNDRKATVPLRKYLREQGIEVAIPAFEGDAAAVRQNHLQFIKQCDAVLLFYGAGDESWKRSFDMELKKLPGYRIDQPLLAYSTYLSEPRTPDKEDLIDMEEPDLILGFTEFNPDSLGDFVQNLIREEAVA